MNKHNRHCEQQRSNPLKPTNILYRLPRQAFTLLTMTFLLFLTACEGMPTSELLKYIKYERQIYVAEAVKQASPELEYGSAAFIRVIKNEAVLELWLKEKVSDRYALYKTYPICSYSGDLGPKLAEGDKQAPEGFYTVGVDQLNPWSKYHLSFNLGFPNEYDEAWGRTGSALMIHGGCQSVGCYAITDEGIEEVYLLVEASIENGHDVPVHIFPFRMSAQAMHIHRANRWYPFWHNLKQGYDLFESTNVPPDYAVDATRYGPQYVFYAPRNWNRLAGM